jgi:homoserine dehydrogenase
VVDPREIHLTALGKPLDSEPTLVGQSKLQELLAVTPVIVVPGYFGHDAQGRLHLLGRGGSDLTAVFLAAATQAKRCRLIKDVDGVYDCDPAIALDTPAHRYATLDYETAIREAAPLIQPKAVKFLERFGASAEVAGLGQRYESVVGPHGNSLEPSRERPPTSVLLLGLGIVGFGVYRRPGLSPRGGSCGTFWTGARAWFRRTNGSSRRRRPRSNAPRSAPGRCSSTRRRSAAVRR